MNFHPLRYFTLSITLPFLSLAVTADPIQPDRPGFSTGTYTVEPKMAHLELGFQSSYANRNDGADSVTLPLLNVRVGLMENTELNILMDGWSNERSNSDTDLSRSDMFFGAKHRLLISDTYNISLLGFLSLPTGNSEGSWETSPFLGLLWDYSINDNISTFGTLQFISFVEADQRSNNFQPAIGLSFTHTDKLSTFVEYYRDMSLNLTTTDSDMFDAGIAYLLTNEIQVDFNFGISIDRDFDDFFGAGFAIRF